MTVTAETVAPLFEPFSLRGMSLKNRIVMAPMTRSHSPGGVPNEENAAYYQRRAAAEVGLIITEGTTIGRPAASGDTSIPNFHTPDALTGWQRVANAVHHEGGRIAPQIWHMGMVRKPGQGPHPDARSDGPSGLSVSGKAVQEPPSENEVLDMAHAFAEAAANAKSLGFDCVELHGAHAYLIDQFLWAKTNQRSDRFGGSIEARAEFAAEIIRLCRNAIGDLPLILRVSQWKQGDYSAKPSSNPDELERLVTVFAEAGVDCIHCSQRRIWEAEFPDVDGESGLNLAGWVKKLSGLPTISVGSVGLNSDFLGSYAGEGSQKRDISDVIQRLEKGEFDLVAVGRALLQDPEWVMKVRYGRWEDIQDYDADAQDNYF